MYTLILFAICTKFVLAAPPPTQINLGNHFEVTGQKCPSLYEMFKGSFKTCNRFTYGKISLIESLDESNSNEVLCRVFLENFETACEGYTQSTNEQLDLNQISSEKTCTNLAFIGNTTDNNYLKQKILGNSEPLCLKLCVSYKGSIEPLCAAAYILNQLVVAKKNTTVIVKTVQAAVPSLPNNENPVEPSGPSTSAISDSTNHAAKADLRGVVGGDKAEEHQETPVSGVY